MIVREILFYGSSFNGQSYPINSQTIPNYSFREIIFFSNGKPDQKIHFSTRKEGDSFLKYLLLSRMIDGEWSDGSETEFDSVDLLELIETLTLSSSH